MLSTARKVILKGQRNFSGTAEFTADSYAGCERGPPAVTPEGDTHG